MDRTLNRRASTGRREYPVEVGRPAAKSTSSEAPTSLVGSGAPDGSDDYDPSEHPIADVLAYVAQHPDMAATVLKRERKGKARAGIVNKLG